MNNSPPNSISKKQLAEAILSSPLSARKRYIVKNGTPEPTTILGKEYALPLIWAGIGTQRSYLDNPEILIPYLEMNQMSFGGDVNENRYHMSFHTHFMMDQTQTTMKDFQFVSEGIKRYGDNIYFTLPSQGDLGRIAQARNKYNVVGQIFLGKEINSTEAGMAILRVTLDGKVENMGVLDVIAMMEDPQAEKIVTAFVDKKFKEEKTGKKFSPSAKEMFSVWDKVNEFIMQDELPAWVSTENSKTFEDTNLTSIGGVNKIAGLFQKTIDGFKGVKMFGEFSMYGIALGNNEKLNTLVEPIKPRIMMPNAWKELRKITAAGMPNVKLFVHEETSDLYYVVNSGAGVQAAENKYVTGKAVVSADEVVLLDGDIEQYLPEILLEEIASL